MAGTYHGNVIFAEGGLGSVSGTVATLPAGAAMGMERWHDGKMYRLFCNASNQTLAKGAGFARSAGSAAGGVGPYSVTVTTTTESLTGVAGACEHATVSTANYFWGVVWGHPVALLQSNISVATDAYVTPAADGKFTLTTTASHKVALNMGDSSTGTATTDAVSGRFFVFFENRPAGLAT